MIENYIDLKLTYKNYLIILKTGVFYISINEDAFILNKLFNYKIKEFNNYKRVGFPINSLNKILKRLDKLNINYIVYDDNKIISKVSFTNNCINKYKTDINTYNSYLRRIKNINNILVDRVNSNNLKDILSTIENILCTII